MCCFPAWLLGGELRRSMWNRGRSPGQNSAHSGRPGSYPEAMTRVRAGAQAPPDRRRPVTVDRAGQARLWVLDLQRSAGNAATAALIRRTTGPGRAPAAPAAVLPIVVARDADFGLRAKAGISGYAGPAADFWRANPGSTLEEFANHLMTEANKQLVANGVPALPAPAFVARGRNAGGFAQHSWTVQLDAAGTAQAPLTSKIGTLAGDRVAEVAGVCFHEARHAEQTFAVARLVAGEGGKDAKAIAAEVGIPETIAAAALSAKGPMPGKATARPGKAALAEIRLWRAIGQTGKHSDYWEWNETFRGFAANVVAGLPSPRPSGVDKIIAAREAFARTLTEWQKDTLPFLDVKITALSKLKRPDSSDTIVLRDVKKIRAAARTVVAEDKTLGDQISRFRARQADPRKPITVAQASGIQQTFELDWLGLEIAVRKLSQVADAAYEAYPHEADAYAAGRAVTKAFLDRAKAPAATPGQAP